ncbi:class I SAM-dependent methyltransferase [Leucobacter sp. GX24907]
MTVPGLEAVFSRLSREPDLDAPELRAYDATDELLLGQDLGDPGAGGLVVIGDRHGALTLGAAALGWRGIRVYQDPLLAQRALARNAERLGFADAYVSHDLDGSLLSGARVVLLQLPRSLDALDEIARSIVRWAAPEVRVFAGGRVKHMTLRMNDVLGRYFGEVTAGLAARKSRVLQAAAPRQSGSAADGGSEPWPRRRADADLTFDLAAFGATFGGAALDHGSRLLLATLGQESQEPPGRIVDLGCGNGVFAVSVARRWPEAHVIATDQSRAAVAATRLTAEWAGAPVLDERSDPWNVDHHGISVHRADATEAVPDGWADLILLNPPFHSGATVHAEVARRLIRACARALQPGGELRVVYNSGLRYRPLIERSIGPTRELARTRTFTVVSAVRR